MGKTISEKILSRKSGVDAYAGDIVVARIDRAMSHDGNRPMPFKVMEKLGAKKLFSPDRYVLFLDHSAPSPDERISNVHEDMRGFARDNGVRLSEVGEGVCHQVMVEQGLALPGELVIGTDSHTCTYGALNAFATGMGSTDLAIAITTGEQWFRVPESIALVFDGVLPASVYSKDVILHLAGLLGNERAIYRTLEFRGDGIRSMAVDDRFTIANMVVEIGAKAGIMEADEAVLRWLSLCTDDSFETVKADEDATYAETLHLDLSSVEPCVARPHRVDDVVPVGDCEGSVVHQGFIGSCTNGRLSDLKVAAEIMRGRKLHPRCRLVVVPASRKILLEALRQGLVEVFLDAGAVVGVPGCGPCGGNHMGIPADGESVISTSNRNFRGRMGNRNAFIYLASPATVAASVLEGAITDPRSLTA